MLFQLRMYVMREGLGKTSTALSSGLTHSFWLILCWYHPRMYVMRKGLGKIFTASRYFFLFSTVSTKVYNALLETSKAGNRSIPFWCLCQKLFFCHYHLDNISTTQSSEWLRISSVQELNLLLWRPWIWGNTTSFNLTVVCDGNWKRKRKKMHHGEKKKLTNKRKSRSVIIWGVYLGYLNS